MHDTPRGNQGALGIFIANQAKFLAFLRKHVRSEAEAEDLLQQGLLNAIRHQADWDAKENILAWFYRILRNALTDHYRSSAAEQRKQETLRGNLTDNLGETLQDMPAFSIPQDVRDPLCSCFKDLLPSLKPEYAEALRRIDLEEEDPAKVAASLGVTGNNLTVRLHRARKSLKTRLEGVCGVCTRHGCLDCTCKRDGKPPH